MSPNASFSYRDDFDPTWKKFQYIAKREGKNASRILRNFVSNYVEVHDPGNPQSRLTSYVEGGSVELSSIEGELREQFRSLTQDGRHLRYKDILQICRDKVSPVSTAVAMAVRIDKWLRKVLGVKVTR